MPKLASTPSEAVTVPPPVAWELTFGVSCAADLAAASLPLCPSHATAAPSTAQTIEDFIMIASALRIDLGHAAPGGNSRERRLSAPAPSTSVCAFLHRT